MKRTRLRPDRYTMNYPLESLFVHLLLLILIAYSSIRPFKDRAAKKLRMRKSRNAWLDPID